jgi:hypothetical protein
LAQALVAEHSTAHAVPLHPSTQDRLAPATHCPDPSHRLAAVSMPLLQVWARQGVPCACRAQAPAPLQLPARPQVVSGSAGQSSWRSSPAPTIVQVPSAPGIPQDQHVLRQSLLQQSPRTQIPEEQVAPTVQG